MLSWHKNPSAILIGALLLSAQIAGAAGDSTENAGTYCQEKCAQAYIQRIDSLTSLNGSREPAEIDRKIKLHNDCVACIYEKWLEKDPKLKGKMIVRFSILPDGLVIKPEMRASNIQNVRFVNEFLGYVSTWRFGRMTKNPDTLRIDYPFTFKGEK